MLMKNSQKYLIVIGSSFGWQVLTLLIFQDRLGKSMPTYFSIAGLPTNYYHYDKPILVPAILFLAALTLANIAIYFWSAKIKNSGILNANIIAKFGQIFTIWLAIFTWILLFYFFKLTFIGQLFMILINLGAFVAMLLLVRQFYRQR